MDYHNITKEEREEAWELRRWVAERIPNGCSVGALRGDIMGYGDLTFAVALIVKRIRKEARMQYKVKKWSGSEWLHVSTHTDYAEAEIAARKLCTRGQATYTEPGSGMPRKFFSGERTRGWSSMIEVDECGDQIMGGS
jgi:hypothetical protein